MKSLYSRACAALTRKFSTEHRTPAEMLPDLTKLHPDGNEPANAQAPAARFFNANSFSADDISRYVNSNCTGSAPGVDGWSFELLRLALEDATFSCEFHAMIVDICNGDVSPDTCLVLAASALVGIPKGLGRKEDGTRPIALGSVIMKVATTFAVRAANAGLKEHFAGVQFGVSCPGGADKIIHSVRRFARDGVRPDDKTAGDRRVIVTIDFSNAFNTPSRDALRDAIDKFPMLQGVFHVAYAQHAKLFVRGTDEHIMSKCGARQGTVDGAAGFSLVLQPALIDAHNCPGNYVLAYLDDATNLSDSPEAAEAAVRALIARAESIGMRINMKKCEIFTPGDIDLVLPAECTTLRGFRRITSASPAIKLLGASIAATNEAEAEHMFAREQSKADMFFKRIRNHPCPQFFTMLRMCGVPKFMHVLRVHAPDVTLELAQMADAMVESLMEFWSSSTIGPTERIILELPVCMGGMGLTRNELIAAAAHHASLTTALGEPGTKPVRQSTLVLSLYNAIHADARRDDAKLRRLLATRSLPGGDAGLSFSDLKWTGDAFGAHLRNELATDSFMVDPAAQKMRCFGCKQEFELGGPWGHHASSCAVMKGGGVTRRHDQVVEELRTFAMQAAFSPDKTEPRDMATVTCGCGALFENAAFQHHRATCSLADRSPHTSGPDLRFYTVDGRTIVVDVTIVNTQVASHRHHSAAEALSEAGRGKHEKYDEMCRNKNCELVAFPVTANGSLAPEAESLLSLIAKRSFENPRSLSTRISAITARGSAAARILAERCANITPPSVSPVAAAIRDPAPATTQQRRQPPATSLEQRIAAGVDHRVRELIRDQAGTFLSAITDAARTIQVKIDQELKRERTAAAAAASSPLGEAAAAATAAEASLPHRAISFMMRALGLGPASGPATATPCPVTLSPERERVPSSIANANHNIVVNRESAEAAGRAATLAMDSDRRTAAAMKQLRAATRETVRSLTRTADADDRALSRTTREISEIRAASADVEAAATISVDRVEDNTRQLSQATVNSQREVADAAARARRAADSLRAADAERRSASSALAASQARSCSSMIACASSAIDTASSASAAAAHGTSAAHHARSSSQAAHESEKAERVRRSSAAPACPRRPTAPGSPRSNFFKYSEVQVLERAPSRAYSEHHHEPSTSLAPQCSYPRASDNDDEMQHQHALYQQYQQPSQQRRDYDFSPSVQQPVDTSTLSPALFAYPEPHDFGYAVPLHHQQQQHHHNNNNTANHLGPPAGYPLSPTQQLSAAATPYGGADADRRLQFSSQPIHSTSRPSPSSAPVTAQTSAPQRSRTPPRVPLAPMSAPSPATSRWESPDRQSPVRSPQARQPSTAPSANSSRASSTTRAPAASPNPRSSTAPPASGAPSRASSPRVSSSPSIAVGARRALDVVA